MVELLEIQPEYIYVTIPAEYICVYHAILNMLSDYGEQMLQDCNCGCNTKNASIIECFNMFNAAVAAKKLNRENLAELLINNVKLKISQLYKKYNKANTSFVFPIDASGHVKGIICRGKIVRFFIKQDDRILYEDDCCIHHHHCSGDTPGGGNTDDPGGGGGNTPGTGGGISEEVYEAINEAITNEIERATQAEQDLSDLVDTKSGAALWDKLSSTILYFKSVADKQAYVADNTKTDLILFRCPVDPFPVEYTETHIYYYTESQWATLTNNDTDYSNVPNGEIRIMEDEEEGGGDNPDNPGDNPDDPGTENNAEFNEETGILTLHAANYNSETNVLTLNGATYNSETQTLNI